MQTEYIYSKTRMVTLTVCWLVKHDILTCVHVAIATRLHKFLVVDMSATSSSKGSSNVYNMLLKGIFKMMSALLSQTMHYRDCVFCIIHAESVWWLYSFLCYGQMHCKGQKCYTWNINSDPFYLCTPKDCSCCDPFTSQHTCTQLCNFVCIVTCSVHSQDTVVTLLTYCWLMTL